MFGTFCVCVVHVSLNILLLLVLLSFVLFIIFECFFAFLGLEYQTGIRYTMHLVDLWCTGKYTNFIIIQMFNKYIYLECISLKSREKFHSIVVYVSPQMHNIRIHHEIIFVRKRLALCFGIFCSLYASPKNQTTTQCWNVSHIIICISVSVDERINIMWPKKTEDEDNNFTKTDTQSYDSFINKSISSILFFVLWWFFLLVIGFNCDIPVICTLFMICIPIINRFKFSRKCAQILLTMQTVVSNAFQWTQFCFDVSIYTLTTCWRSLLSPSSSSFSFAFQLK